MKERKDYSLEMYGARDYRDSFPHSMANSHYASYLAVLCISTTPYAFTLA